MTKTLAVVLTLAITASATQQLRAQESDVPRGLHRRALVYHHSSTLQEGLLRGWADYISAVGEYLVNRSTAVYIFQQAREKWINVEAQRIGTRWQIRDAYHARRFPTNRVDVAKLTEWNRARAPERLPSHTLVATTTIHWPAALQGDAFAPGRKTMEHALALRAAGDYGPQSTACAEATQARDAILETLRGQVHDLRPMQYIAARRFVESLGYEAMFPASSLRTAEWRPQ